MKNQLVLTFKGKKHIFKEMPELNNDNTVIWIEKNGKIIKTFGMDLGPVNEDGLLFSPWNKELFPQIVHEVNSERINPQSGEEEIIKDLWYVVLEGNPLICTDEFFTKQEAIDNWNRRV